MEPKDYVDLIGRLGVPVAILLFILSKVWTFLEKYMEATQKLAHEQWAEAAKQFIKTEDQNREVLERLVDGINKTNDRLEIMHRAILERKS